MKKDASKQSLSADEYEAEFRRVAKEHLRDYVLSVTDAAPRFGSNAFICPCCKSGTGNNNRYTPAFFLFRTQKGELHFKCQACGITGDIFDLVGLTQHEPSFYKQQKIVASFLGVNFDLQTPLSNIDVADEKAFSQPNQTESMQLRKAARAYIAECEKHISETDYFKQRGFSDETISRFHLGYDPKDKMAVIPFTPTYYMCRNTEVGTDASGRNKHRKPAGLRQPLFNLLALNKEGEPVFLTEAPIDAMSIEQSGGRAMALGGTSTTLLKKVLDVYQPNVPFILAFDNDAAGRHLQEKVSGLLANLDIPHTLPTHSAFQLHKDANAALMTDPFAFGAAVAAEVSRCRSFFRKNEQEEGR